MKVKYIGTGNLISCGVTFTKDIGEVEVKDVDGRYLITTFKDSFIEIEKKTRARKKVEE